MRNDAILGTSQKGSDHLQTAGASLAHPQDCRRGPHTEGRKAAAAHSPQLLARAWRRLFSSAAWQTHRQPLLGPRLPTNGAADPIAPIPARRPQPRGSSSPGRAIASSVLHAARPGNAAAPLPTGRLCPEHNRAVPFAGRTGDLSTGPGRREGTGGLQKSFQILPKRIHSVIRVETLINGLLRRAVTPSPRPTVLCRGVQDGDGLRAVARIGRKCCCASVRGGVGPPRRPFLSMSNIYIQEPPTNGKVRLPAGSRRRARCAARRCARCPRRSCEGGEGGSCGRLLCLPLCCEWPCLQWCHL